MEKARFHRKSDLEIAERTIPTLGKTFNNSLKDTATIQQTSKKHYWMAEGGQQIRIAMAF